MRTHTVADDADVDVGLEQRGADLLQDLVDVGLGEAALAADLLDDAFEAGGQRFEHALARLSVVYGPILRCAISRRRAPR
jgi:hypothetical protein